MTDQESPFMAAMKKRDDRRQERTCEVRDRSLEILARVLEKQELAPLSTREALIVTLVITACLRECLPVEPLRL